MRCAPIPSDDHLLPLYVALGAAGEGARAERLHAGIDDYVIAMDAFAFQPDELTMPMLERTATPSTAIALHWLMALLLVGLFAVGLYMARSAAVAVEAEDLFLAQVGRRHGLPAGAGAPGLARRPSPAGAARRHVAAERFAAHAGHARAVPADDRHSAVRAG